MLYANLLKACCIELIFSDAAEREALMNRLAERPHDESKPEQQARQYAINLCNAVFSECEPIQEKKRGKNNG